MHSGKIISNGNASLAGTSKLSKKAVTRHAEMDAIYKLRSMKRKRRMTLWSLRWKEINGKKILANAKPCAYCQKAAIENGIYRVFYSDESGEIVKGDLRYMSCSLTASAYHIHDVPFSQRQISGRTRIESE